MTIVEFLRARLDEDAEAARQADELDGVGAVLNFVEYGTTATETGEAHIARHDPARVLREVDAKRAIVKELAGFGWVPDDPDLDEPEFAYGLGRAYYDMAKQLAAVYCDHPDYQEAWRP